jgi:hypothetical protein
VPVLTQRPVESQSVRPEDLPMHVAPPDGVLLPKSVLILLIVFAVAALGIAFFAGFLFGKQTATEFSATSFNPHPKARPGQSIARGCGLIELRPHQFIFCRSPKLGAIPYAC